MRYAIDSGMAANAHPRAGRTGSIPRELQNVHADGVWTGIPQVPVLSYTNYSNRTQQNGASFDQCAKHKCSSQSPTKWVCEEKEG